MRPKSHLHNVLAIRAVRTARLVLKGSYIISSHSLEIFKGGEGQTTTVKGNLVPMLPRVVRTMLWPLLHCSKCLRWYNTSRLLSTFLEFNCYHYLARKRRGCSNLPYNYSLNYDIILSQFNPFTCLTAFLGLSKKHCGMPDDVASKVALLSAAQLPATRTARWKSPEC